MFIVTGPSSFSSSSFSSIASANAQASLSSSSAYFNSFTADLKESTVPSCGLNSVGLFFIVYEYSDGFYEGVPKLSALELVKESIVFFVSVGDRPGNVLTIVDLRFNDPL